jgi:hypothetical protein
MKLPSFFGRLNTTFRFWSGEAKYAPKKRFVFNASAVMQDDIDNLKELFEKPSIDEYPGLIQVDPSIKVVRRLRVRGLIEVGYYREGTLINFGDEEKVTSESIQVIVARLTGMGKIAMNTVSVDELVEQYKPVA